MMVSAFKIQISKEKCKNEAAMKFLFTVFSLDSGSLFLNSATLTLPLFFAIISREIQQIASSIFLQARSGVQRLITEYGYDSFFTVTVVCCVVIAGSYFFIPNPFVKYTLIALAGVAFLLTLNFFRDPDRATPPGNNIIVSPADGTVVE